jgi:aminoglycoside phosphotransferase (APT) family kinase protein
MASSTDPDPASPPVPAPALAPALASVVGAAEVTDLVRLSGGASRETWRFSADGRPLVLQRQRSGDGRDMGVEASVLRAAGAAGMPVARVVASDTGAGTPLGASYMVLTAVEGETIARKILRDDDYAEARRLLPAQLGAALAQLHAIPVDAAPGLVEQDQITTYRDMLDSLGQAHPTFELAFRWLERHRPPSPRTAIVHGDFRLGNVIVGPDGLRAVLDWELAHLGDPMEDLGWLCVKAWRFGGDRPVAGLGDRRELFDAYEAAGGRPVDPDEARWWEVLGTLKWGIMCILQCSAHTHGFSRSHELAAIGRRVCENEHDLFLALEGHW